MAAIARSTDTATLGRVERKLHRAATRNNMSLHGIEQKTIVLEIIHGGLTDGDVDQLLQAPGFFHEYRK